MPRSYQDWLRGAATLNLFTSGAEAETLPDGRPTLAGLARFALSSLLSPVEAPTKAALDAMRTEPRGRLGRTDDGLYWRWDGAAWVAYADPVAAEALARAAALSSEASARAAGDAALGAELAGKLSAPAPGEILDVPAGALGPNGRVVAAARSSDGRTPERIYADGSRWILPSADLRSDILHGGGREGEILDIPGRPPAAIWRTTDGRLGRARYADGSEGGAVSREMRSDLLYGGGREGEILDLPGRPPAAIWRTTDGRLGRARYRDGGWDMPPAPEFVARLGLDSASIPAITNLHALDVASVRSEAGRLVVSAADRWLPVRVFVVPTADGAPRTALMARAKWRIVIIYGQSNAQGNTDGIVLHGTPLRPAQALMLSTGVRGTGATPSNAGAISGFLPAVEAGVPASPKLGETMASSLLNALAREDGPDERVVYVARVPAMGGYRADQLAPGSIPFANSVAELRRIVELAQIAEPVEIEVLVVYVQGESDAIGDPIGSPTPEGLYTAHVQAILDGFRAEALAAGAARFTALLMQAGTNASAATYRNYPAALQEQMARTHTGGWLHLGDPFWRHPLHDNYHVTAEAQARAGELAARSYRRILAGERAGIGVGAHRVAGEAVEIDFLLPKGAELELREIPGLRDYGFLLRGAPFDPLAPSAGAEVPLTAVTLTEVEGRRSRVVLTSSSPPQPGWQVTFAFGPNNSAPGLHYGARGGLFAVRPDAPLFVLGGQPMDDAAPVFTRIL